MNTPPSPTFLPNLSTMSQAEAGVQMLEGEKGGGAVQMGQLGIWVEHGTWRGGSVIG